jgi:hypothetical protein
LLTETFIIVILMAVKELLNGYVSHSTPGLI